VDADGAIRDVNPAAEEMFGYRRDELLGQTVEILVPARSRAAHKHQRDAYIENPRSRPMGIGMELTGRRKDESEFPVEISLSPMPAEDGNHVIAIVHDVSERKRLRAFGVGAMRAAEEERQRIARELHDDTAQRLAALLVQLRLATRVPEIQREALLEEVRSGIEATADSVRRIARNLRPPALEELGVMGAIRTHARSLTEAFGLGVEIEAPRWDKRPAPEVELAIYRVVQEALANIVRHAHAKRAHVTIALKESTVEVQISDEGRGFDPTAVDRQGRGLGLLGMHERARNVGGELTVESAPGGGTRICVRLPMEAQAG
jgi:PAS domain S-box-containing protein